jgi:hypothetical protein
MAEYTIVRVADVPDQAAEVGMDPDHFEIRFLREPLELRNFAVTFERFGGGWRPPKGHPHRRRHRPPEIRSTSHSIAMLGVAKPQCKPGARRPNRGTCAPVGACCRLH